MIISKTPFRISLIGGGTDFPQYYKIQKGLVIGGTIDKYSYVSARFLPNVFNYKHRIVWSKNEVVKNNNEIIHPTVNAVFKYLKIKRGLEIHYQGDLQKNSGLGTSSSFCVGLINSIKNLYKIKINKEYLAKISHHIEQNVMREKCGSQDPIWAAYGGFNSISFYKNSFQINKVKLGNKKLINLSKNLLLIYTGINKFSHNIEKDKLSNFKSNLKHLEEIYNLAKLLKYQFINNNNYDFVGDLLNEYWSIKKKLSKKVTNFRINEIYDECINIGATGGKLIGSGGGGFLLIYCKNKIQKKLIKKLYKLPIIRFNFINEGSKIIFKS